ncbi:MAG: hypothetical protein ACLR4Z_13465 [Butyricicoccaceae bacterium]
MTKEQIAAIAVVLLLARSFSCGYTAGSRNRRRSRRSRDRCLRPAKCAARCAAPRRRSRANSGNARGAETADGLNEIRVQRQGG